MNILLKLSLTKKKAKIRSLFAKPSTAIFTSIFILLILASLGFSIYSTATKSEATLAFDVITLAIYCLFAMLMTTFLILISLFQKRKALFFEEDSYFLFVGPFSNKQILNHASRETFFNSFLYAVISVLMATVSLMATSPIPVAQIFLCLLVNTLYTFVAIQLLDILYVKDMVKDRKTNTQTIIAIFLIIAFLGYAIYSYMQGGLDIQNFLANFITTNDFNYIPLIGWVKGAMFALFEADYLMVLLYVGLFVVVCSIVHIIFINIKGYFYERAMIDAVDYSDYYKKAMAGESTGKQKLYSASTTYKQGAGAIFSKNWLTMKKMRTFLSTQDLVSIIVVIAYAFIFDSPYAFFGMFVFYLSQTVNGSSFEQELKTNYIYLLPDTNKRKLYYALVIPMFKTFLFTMIQLVAVCFIINMTVDQIVLGFALSLTFIPLCYSTVIFSAKFFKGKLGKMMEVTLRMLITIAACLPSIGICYLIYRYVGFTSYLLPLAVGIVVVVNLAASYIIFTLCAPMMSGNAYMAE